MMTQRIFKTMKVLIVLLFFSLIFYGFGGPKLLLLMISVVFIDYIAALLIDKFRKKKIKLFIF